MIGGYHDYLSWLLKEKRGFAAPVAVELPGNRRRYRRTASHATPLRMLRTHSGGLRRVGQHSTHYRRQAPA